MVEEKGATETFMNVASSLIAKKKVIFNEKGDVSQLWKDQLDGVTEAGDSLRQILENNSSMSNQSDLKKMSSKFEQLCNSVDNNFDDMNSLIKEAKFFNRIMLPTSILSSYLKDCLKNPGSRAYKNFRKVYQSASPLTIFYNLMSFLEEISTNPVKIAMNKEGSAAIFTKWNEIVLGVLGTFMFLEAFTRGLLGNKNKYNLEQMMEATIDIRTIINEWNNGEEQTEEENEEEEQIQVDPEEKCWEEMKAFLNEFIPNNSNLSNSQKADEIQAKLDSYSTKDAFYLCVFNEATMNREYTYHCANEGTQMITVNNKGKCNVILYRSHKAKASDSSVYEKAQRDVNASRVGLQYTGTLENMIQQQLIGKGIWNNDGFICLIEHKTDPQIRFTSCKENGKGPGWWERVVINSSDGKQISQKALVVGLP